MFDQPVLAVQDEEAFTEVEKALQSAFSGQAVEGFLSNVQKKQAACAAIRSDSRERPSWT